MPTSVWGRGYTRPSVLSCLLILGILGPQIATAQTIVIGEVNWAGSDASIADEWVELWNLGTDSQSLAGWRLEGISQEPLTFQDSHIIGPQEAFLISNYDQNEKRSALSVQPALVTTEVSLANDKLHITLFDAEENIIDEAGTGGKPLAGSTQPPSSMVRQDPTLEGTKAEVWATSNQTANLKPDTLSYGTPAICDGCGVGSTTDSSPPIPEQNSTTTLVDTPPPQSAPSSTIEAVTSTLAFSTSTNDIDDAIPTSTQEHVSSTLTDIPPSQNTSSSTIETTTSTLALHTSTSYVDDTVSTSTQESVSSTLYTTPTTTLSLQTTSTLVLTTATTTEEQSITSTPVVTLAATPAAPLSTSPSSETTVPLSACNWEIMAILPAPSDGSEWIEVGGCPLEQPGLDSWSIYDPEGKILTITMTTPLLSTEDGYFRIHLPGQHLRNTGDTVMLRGPEGSLYDIVAYPSMKHDERYKKREDATWWIPERAPAQTSEQTIIPAPTSPTPPANPTPTPASLTTKTASASAKTTPISNTLTAPTKPSPVFSLSYEEYKTPLPPPEKKPAAKSPKATPPAKTTKAKAPSMPTTQSTRIRLQGTVGTPPGLVGKQRFVLLNTEGKGLLIHANNKQPSPPLDSSIEISGTLMYANDEPYLNMYAEDRWHPRSNDFPSPEPQVLDLESTDPEKNWSLVELIARVSSSKQASATIVVDDLDITVVIPRSLNYRADRLNKGDLVRIRGVVDISGDIPRLYPRTASEIVLVEAAKTLAPVAPTQTNSLPPWAPISAASTTIVGGYSWRRLQKWKEQKRLEEQLEHAVKELSSTS